MVTVEQHKEHAYLRGKQKQPILSERVRVQQTATIMDAEFVERLLAVAVQWSEVHVGRRAIDADILVRGTEDPGDRSSAAVDLLPNSGLTCE